MITLIYCFIDKFKKLLIMSVIIVPTTANAAESGQILTSIKPLMLVAREITSGAGLKVVYLLPPTISEHNYALRVSDIKRLRGADLVIWLGPEIEPYLESSLNNWVSEQKSTKSLPLLEKMVFDEPIYDDDEVTKKTALDKGRHNIDPHIWLSPPLAQQMARQISDRLSLIYPADKPRFEANFEIFSRKILALDKVTDESLKAHKNKPFFVYHGAYSYFIKRYGLNQIGVLHAQPGAAMSLKELSELQLAMEKQTQGVCLFREPQFALAPAPAFKGTNVMKTGALDPLGINADSYELLIEQLTKGFLQCFAQN